MKKFFAAICLMVYGIIGNCQDINHPLFNEKAKNGIYKTFEEFKYNLPSITDSYYIESIARTSKVWEGTFSYTPKYSATNKIIRKNWGFCENGQIFIFHQLDYFPLEIRDNSIVFFAYGNMNQVDNGAIIAGVAGGAIGAGIYSAVAIAAAKKQITQYSLNPLDGTISDGYNTFDSSEILSIEVAKLIIYRTGKKELDLPFELSINDSTKISVVPNSVFELECPVGREPVVVCYNENYKDCINLVFLTDDTKYLECTIPSSIKVPRISEVKTEVGVFYAQQAQHFQNKREGKK